MKKVLLSLWFFLIGTVAIFHVDNISKLKEGMKRESTSSRSNKNKKENRDHWNLRKWQNDVAQLTEEGEEDSKSLSSIPPMMPVTPFAVCILSYKLDLTIFHWTSFLPAENFTIFFIEDSIQTDEILSFDKIRLQMKYYQKQSVNTSSSHPVHHNTTMTDGQQNNTTQGNQHRYIVHIHKQHPLRNDYWGMNYLRGEVTAWDKAIYFLSEITPYYKLMWIFEDDVLVTTTQAFLKVHKEGIRKKSDLIGGKVHKENGRKNNWQWYSLKTFKEAKVPHPYYHGVVCAVGFSPRLLHTFQSHMRIVHRLDFLEGLFFTLAMHAHLNIYNAQELNTTIRWNRSWSCDTISQNASLWFHPIKNQSNFIHNCIQKDDDWKPFVKYQLDPQDVSRGEKPVVMKVND